MMIMYVMCTMMMYMMMYTMMHTAVGKQTNICTYIHTYIHTLVLANLRVGGVVWYRDGAHDLRGKQVGVEGSLEPDLKLHPGAAHLLDDGGHFERQADALCAAVLHQLKLAVWWHKADDLFGVEAAEIDALMKRHILW